MLSRAQRRYRDKQKKSDADVIEEKKKSNPWLYAGSVLILILIIVTFVGTPTVRNSGNMSGGIVFGSYEGKEVSYVADGYFANRREAIGEQVKASGEATDSVSVYYQIGRQAFDDTLRHVAILKRAEDGGLYISDDAVDKAVIHYGPYQENGEFSESRYNRASPSDKFATRQLFREELAQMQFEQEAISGVLASKAASDRLATMVSPERSFDYVAFPFSDYPADKVVEYGTANAAKFARIKLSRILVKSGKKEADGIKTRLTADPLRFEEIAKSSSKDSYAAGGGAMGWQYHHELERDFEKTEPVDAVFALKQGEISDPIEGKYGWVLFRCDEPRIAIDMSLEEDRQTVRSYLDRYEAGLIQDYALQTAKGFVSSARQDGFAKTASKGKLTVDTTTFFPMNYQAPFVHKPVSSASQASSGQANASVLSDALYSEDFFKAAFSVRDGEVTEPVVLGKAVVVLQLKAEREASAEDIEMMDDYYTYFAEQTLKADLDSELLDPSKVVDKFDETYVKYLAPKGS